MYKTDYKVIFQMRGCKINSCYNKCCNKTASTVNINTQTEHRLHRYIVNWPKLVYTVKSVNCLKCTLA